MMTLDQIRTILKEETEKLHKIGIKPNTVKSVTLVKAKSFYADACRTTGAIRVSEYFLDAPEIEIRATMVHELLHLVPEAGHGHGGPWKALAARVNRAYPEYNIRRCDSNVRGGSNWSLRAAALRVSTTPQKIFKVKCTCCGREWIRSRRSRLTDHPELYHCQCGGKIIRVL